MIFGGLNAAQVDGELEDVEDLSPSRDEATQGPADAVRPQGPSARAGGTCRATSRRDRGNQTISLRVFVLSNHRLSPGRVAGPGARRRRCAARPAAVRGRPLGDGAPGCGAGDRAGADRGGGRAGGTTSRPARSRGGGDRGWWPAGSSSAGRTKVGFLESSLRTICHDASQPGRTGFTISAIDRRGAGRDCPPSPSDGSCTAQARSAWSRLRGGSHAR